MLQLKLKMNARRTAIFFTIGLSVFFLGASFLLMQSALADYYGSIGTEKLQARDYASADRFLRKSFLLPGSNAEYRVNHGQVLYALAGRASSDEAALDLLKRAEHSFAEAARLNPLEGNGWFGLAQTCWWLSAFNGYENRAEKVGHCFERAFRTEPSNGKFLYALVDYNLSTQRQTQNDNLVESLAMVYPQAWSDLGKHPGFSAGLRDCFVRGLERAAANPLTGSPALRILADLAADAHEWDKAATFAGQLIERTGKCNTARHDQYYLDLGYYRMKSGKMAESKKAYLRGIMLSKNRVQTLSRIFPAFEEAGLPDAYLELAEAASSSDAVVKSFLPVIRGKVALFMTGDLGYAAECFHSALRQKESAAPHRYLAEIAMRKHGWARAESEINRAIMLEPRDAELHYLLARSLEEQKKYTAALDAAEHAIRQSPKPIEGHYVMQGRLFEAIQDYPAAIQAWEAARRLNPKNAQPIRQIAQGYRNLGDFENAQTHYLAALALTPGDEATIRELDAVRKQILQPETAKKESRTLKR